ncbi:hypothetical protein [Aeoliella sp.]|uniref:hypothetical protein n=1 Tax=Aeoliella sp. TaxID=2795800 RepID=UPI003CCBAAF8
MKQWFANPADDNPLEQSHRGWSGKLGVWLLLGAVITAFVVVTVIVLTAPLTRNELGVLGGLKIGANADTMLFVGDRHIGTGTVEVPWNDLLGAAGRPPLAVPESDGVNLAGEGAELIWSQDGPNGAHRGAQNVNYKFRQELYRRADGELDHLFVITCEFPDTDSKWSSLRIPIRARKQADAGYFPQPSLQGGGNINRGMIPSRRDEATFQLNLHVRDGVWPKVVEEGERGNGLWQPE